VENHPNTSLFSAGKTVKPAFNPNFYFVYQNQLQTNQSSDYFCLRYEFVEEKPSMVKSHETYCIYDRKGDLNHN
jgi:hypothetical protein